MGFNVAAILKGIKHQNKNILRNSNHIKEKFQIVISFTNNFLSNANIILKKLKEKVDENKAVIE